MSALRRRLRRGERGFTLVESLVSMTILMTVMGGMTALMVSGTNAEVEHEQALSGADGGAARARQAAQRRPLRVRAAVDGEPAPTTVTLTMSATCPTSGGGTSVTWCTVANGTGRYGLWRYIGAACSGTGRKVADYLTTANAFTYFAPPAPAAGSKEAQALLGVTLDVNLTPTKPERVYALAGRRSCSGTALRPA